VVGALRQLGFASVYEVAFGAELVASEYPRLLSSTDKLWIATTCPAVVSYVEHYHPDLTSSLAPIVSPMVATARLVRALPGGAQRVVFVGPCIAKKREAVAPELVEEVDSVLTFTELRKMLESHGIDPEAVTPSEFDPPHSRGGGLFPISGGMLQVAGIQEDLVAGHAMVAEGPAEFVQAIKEAGSGLAGTRLLEVLFCKGCTMGPGMSTNLPHFGRRARVSQYVRQRLATTDIPTWSQAVNDASSLDLSRSFQPRDMRLPVPSPEDLTRLLAELGKTEPAHELNCCACGYSSCRELASAIYSGLAEREMCLPHAIEHLRETVRELVHSHDELANAQMALVRSERLASMGQLAAGIAHEVNNPLGVVVLYANLLKEAIGDEAVYRDDLTMVVEQADRCKKIVAGLLDFARQSKVEHQRINVAELVQRGLRGIAHPVGVDIVVEHDVPETMIEVDPDQITQVLVNLFANAFGAMPDGGTLSIRTENAGDRVRFVVSDTGTGIPTENLSKLFEPFFTTKKGGKGTGLGLAVSYGIVKMHRGDIRVFSNANPAEGPTGTTFTVQLPHTREQRQAAQ
jgi:signal transduction histidine kinase